MTQIFADGADLRTMVELNQNKWVDGFTTNPSLMRKAGVTDYAGFARELLSEIKDKPVSFEVLSNKLDGMEREANIIAGWGPNAVVKIPIMYHAFSVFTYSLVEKLSHSGVTVNVTAIMTAKHAISAINAIGNRPGYVSVFAGRIADTGVDPLPIMKQAMKELRPGVKLVWASAREIFNLYQARHIRCPVITLPPELIRKMPLHNKDLSEYSWETCKQFLEDGRASGLTL